MSFNPENVSVSLELEIEIEWEWVKPLLLIFYIVGDCLLNLKGIMNYVCFLFHNLKTLIWLVIVDYG